VLLVLTVVLQQQPLYAAALGAFGRTRCLTADSEMTTDGTRFCVHQLAPAFVRNS